MRKNKIYLSAITLLLSSTLTIASDPSNDVENPFGVTSAKGMKYEALDIEIPSDTSFTLCSRKSNFYIQGRRALFSFPRTM